MGAASTPDRRDVNGNIHTTTRPCACGAMMLDGNELANGSHVQPVDGSWMCVHDEPTTLKETPMPTLPSITVTDAQYQRLARIIPGTAI